jgi:hypothetical protein
VLDEVLAEEMEVGGRLFPIDWGLFLDEGVPTCRTYGSHLNFILRELPNLPVLLSLYAPLSVWAVEKTRQVDFVPCRFSMLSFLLSFRPISSTPVCNLPTDCMQSHLPYNFFLCAT